MKHLAIPSILACLSLLCACQTVNTVEPALSQAQPDYVEDKRIVTDWSLKRIVTVEAVKQVTVSGDLLKIQVDVLNKTNKPHSFNYMFEFYDTDGMVVQSPALTWKSMQVLGRDRVSLTAVAPSPRAKDFRLKLIESN